MGFADIAAITAADIGMVAFVALSAVFLAASVAVFVLFFTGSFRFKPNWTFQPAYIVGLSLFLVAEFFVMMSVFFFDESLGKFEATLIALQNAFKMFTIDVDMVYLTSKLAGNTLLLSYITVYMVVAPILSVGTLLSLLKDYVALFRLSLSKSNDEIDVYIFSKLTEESLTLAQDIRNKEIAKIRKNDKDLKPWKLRRELRKECLFIFTDVDVKGDQTELTLLDRAYDMDAIMFSKDIVSLKVFSNIRPLSDIMNAEKKVWFFAMGENEEENVSQTLKLVNRLNAILQNKKTRIDYSNMPDIKFFVFSNSDESERLFDKVVRENIDNLTRKESFSGLVIRVDVTQQLIHNHLYDNGSKMFIGADTNGLSKNHIDVQQRVNAVVVGIGSCGSEMVKALPWYCHMNSQGVQIDVFDSSIAAFDRLEYQSSPLFAQDKNGSKSKHRKGYEIRTHKGIDVFSKQFMDKYMEILSEFDVDYVLVALGSDEDNIKAAMNIRMLSERMGRKPKIEAVVYNSEHAAALQDLCILKWNEDKKRVEKTHRYDIDFIGDIKSYYCLDNIFKEKMINEAKEIHVYWKFGSATLDEKNLFYTSDYCRRSSMSGAVRSKAREDMGWYSLGNESERKTMLEYIEHIGWWHWMLADGFVYSENRNDLAKQHSAMTPFSELDDSDKEKAIRIAYKQGITAK